MEWLLEGPLHVGGVYDLVREYVGFQGVCVRDEWKCNEWINDVLMLPDGKIACARNKAVRIWGSDCEAVLEGHTDLVLCLAYRSQLASGSSDFTVRLWGTGSVLKGHKGTVFSLAFLEADRLASGSADRTVRIWNGEECVQIFDGHTGTVQDLVVLNGGVLASGSTDMTVRIWDRNVSVMRGHHEWVTALAVLEDGTLVSGGLDRRIRRWRDGSCVNIINTSWFGVVIALASLPGNLIACGFHDALVLFDAVGNIVFIKSGVDVLALSFFRGKLVVGTKLGSIQVWE